MQITITVVHISEAIHDPKINISFVNTQQHIDLSICISRKKNQKQSLQPHATSKISDSFLAGFILSWRLVLISRDPFDVIILLQINSSFMLNLFIRVSHKSIHIQIHPDCTISYLILVQFGIQICQ